MRNTFNQVINASYWMSWKTSVSLQDIQKRRHFSHNLSAELPIQEIQEALPSIALAVSTEAFGKKLEQKKYPQSFLLNGEEICFAIKKLPKKYHYWRDLEIRDLMFSMLLSNQKEKSGSTSRCIDIYYIAYINSSREGGFNSWDAKVLQWVITEFPHLILPIQENEINLQSDLTSQQSSVLKLLLKGWNRKKIAEYLSISIHTVNEYVKAIYKHHEVKSHAELVVKVLSK